MIDLNLPRTQIEDHLRDLRAAGRDLARLIGDQLHPQRNVLSGGLCLPDHTAHSHSGGDNMIKQAREEVERHGEPVIQYAECHGLDPASVRALLAGARPDLDQLNDFISRVYDHVHSAPQYQIESRLQLCLLTVELLRTLAGVNRPLTGQPQLDPAWMEKNAKDEFERLNREWLTVATSELLLDWRDLKAWKYLEGLQRKIADTTSPHDTWPTLWLRLRRILSVHEDPDLELFSRELRDNLLRLCGDVPQVECRGQRQSGQPVAEGRNSLMHVIDPVDARQQPHELPGPHNLIDGAGPITPWRAEHWPELRDAACELVNGLDAPLDAERPDRDRSLHERLGKSIFRLAGALVKTGELYDRQSQIAVDRRDIFARWNCERYARDMPSRWASTLMERACRLVAWGKGSETDVIAEVARFFSSETSPRDGTCPSRPLADIEFYRDMADRIKAFLNEAVRLLRPSDALGGSSMSVVELTSVEPELADRNLQPGNHSVLQPPAEALDGIGEPVDRIEPCVPPLFNGPAVKSARTNERNALIRSWSEQGLSMEDIYKLMKEQRPDLLRMKKQRDKTIRYTTLNSMILKYRRDQRSQNNCNNSEQLQ
jgi:hypothetical protein